MKRAFLTVDLGFGDAGKGSTVDFLVRAYNAHLVVRYNGGAQAGHRVVTAEATPREHVFSQFGSGTLAGARTHLSRFMLLEPLAMLAEEAHLRELGVSAALERTSIDAGALVITPYQRAVNRLKELARGANRHGSCGLGIGETQQDALDHGEQAIRAGDLAHPATLESKLHFLHTINAAKLEALRSSLPDDDQTGVELAWFMDPTRLDWLLNAYAHFAERAHIVPATFLHAALRRAGTVVFEGAQGVLLDEWCGFHPHTTWATTTFAQADTLLTEASYEGDISRIGITRAYSTRHGAGPFVTEDAALTKALPDAANTLHAWQQQFRVGWPDLVLLRYARAVVGPLDALAITCLDRLADLPAFNLCDRYRFDTFTVDSIAPSPHPQNLDYQEQITRNLLRCRPVLEPVASPDALIARLQEAVGAQRYLLSHGPTAADKTWF